MEKHQIANKLYLYRSRLGLSQQELADKLSITNKAVSKWENGSSLPSTEILIKLSKVFDVTIDELLKEEEKQKKISKIVITGGPCAGKSTAMSWIQNKFTKEGYDVLFIAETATELIKSGITPVNTSDILNFQKLLLELQIKKEITYDEAVRYMHSDKILIVCDRGCNDVKAYLTEEDYRKVLHKIDKNEISLRDSYDAVFHLVTAANGAEEFYTLANNEARYETKEEACNVDVKLIDSWTGHPHFRIIDNATDFEEKMKRLISEVSHFLGEPEAFEIERKFLIKYPDLKLLEKKGTKVEIIQTYLNCLDGEEVRIRQRGIDGNYIYSKTTKKDVSAATRLETEKRLSRDEYLELLLDADTSLNQIRKTRYCIIYKNQYFELDVYPFWEDKAILEIELQNENDKISIPKYLTNIKEVTDDPNYRNYNLARVRRKD